ncbi:YncE family protein [Terracidiphilus sp.]|jgi:DNA-binding beta-propeller fold protein YncE|uniref:YncE family protein n=1 Tax=Terracidiphilus sp. TaxID=1964191 RepID=UPI003C249FE4
MKKFVLALALVTLISLPANAQQPLTLQRTITLPGVAGKFDHFALDLQGKRLFAAATGKHSVEVIDLASSKVQQSIAGLGKPHGLAWVASTNSLYVSDGALAQLFVYKGKPESQLTLAGKLKLSDDADDMVYDEATHLLFVGTGGSDSANPAQIAVVNTTSFTLASAIAVATHPEALEIDAQGQRVFANIADSSEVAVIDGAGKAISNHWKLTGASDNVPLAFDAEHHLIYVACRKPATLLVIDADSGKEISRVATVGGADDLFYDAALRRVYVIGGAGEVHTYQVDAHKKLQPLGVLRTAAGAKTALFVPSQSLLYVGVPSIDGHDAEIRIYSTAASTTARGNQ